MTQIETVNNQKFIFNGIEYYKNFMPKVVGDKIEIINVYDSKIRLTDFPTLYSDIEVDGIVYASVNTTQVALLPVLYTRGSLTGGDSLFLGNFISLAALQAAYPTAPSGSRANIVVSGGQDDLAVWDSGDSEWVVFSGQGGGSVTSVNGYVDAVVLDADDIDDSTTAHKFASESELQQIATNTTDIVDLKAKKPVANTYTNTTALLADQENQEEGYLYGITDATGLFNITQGRATVSYKGTTNGDESDYNIEWRDDLSNVKTVNTYEDIPLEEGVYYITQESLVVTNAKSFEDGSEFEIDLLGCFVIRKKINNENRFLNQIHSLSSYVGYNYNYIEEEGEEEIEPIRLNDIYLPKNYSLRESGTSFKEKGKIEFDLKENDFESEGLIKFPYDLEFSVLSSNLTINEKDISHEFVFISDSVNETVTPYIRLLDGFKEDNSLFIKSRLNLQFTFETSTDTTYKIQSFEPVTKEFTTDGSGLIINDNSLSHSNEMKLWVQEYINNNLTGTPPTIIGYENFDVSFKSGQDEYRQDVMYRNNSDLICSALEGSFNKFNQNDQNKDIFKVIALGSNTLERLDRTTAEDDFLADVVMVTSRAETDNDGTDPKGSSYGFGVEFNEPTRDADLTAIGLSIQSGLDAHQQSPATAIVTAKFKWLRNETNAPWGLIREACRATASNANNYNIYRGFGQIDANAAKTYIESNIDTWTGVNTTELAEYYDAISPYNTAVTLEEKTDKTPMTKGDYVNDKAYISGRMGTAQSNPAAPTVAKFDEFWSDSGNITYEAATGKFFINKAGVYNILFNGVSNSNITRVTVLVNTTTTSNTDNIGNAYTADIYTSINVSTTYEFEAGDYVVFCIADGGLRNVPATHKYNEFSIYKIA